MTTTDSADVRARQRDAERTKRELLEVATTVFAEEGLAGARVDDIAARTSTTKRMIYYYFGGKEQLYAAVLQNAYRGIREAERTIDVADLGPADALRALAEATYDHHVQHSDFIRLVMIENIHRAEVLKKLDTLEELGQPAVDVLEDIMARGRAEGIFRDDLTPFDLHMLISSYCVFQVANQHTFGHLFQRELLEEPTASRARTMLGDLVVRWIMV
ncbi:TetR/AcrR family transcriptional regulator [Brevibacterium yomogidense]|uniref:TetR/AcrR family transcriptional regulator n=1 Tax=Brevibacterium yomogidense TaxID=946573 RepID=UPI0018DEF2ED|nr:TetR/AcrR family transcriptional regulator [Brevibacterium yomogidense]